MLLLCGRFTSFLIFTSRLINARLAWKWPCAQFFAVCVVHKRGPVTVRCCHTWDPLPKRPDVKMIPFHFLSMLKKTIFNLADSITFVFSGKPFSLHLYKFQQRLKKKLLANHQVLGMSTQDKKNKLFLQKSPNSQTECGSPLDQWMAYLPVGFLSNHLVWMFIHLFYSAFKKAEKAFFFSNKHIMCTCHCSDTAYCSESFTEPYDCHLFNKVDLSASSVVPQGKL